MILSFESQVYPILKFYAQNLLCNTVADYNFCLNATGFYNVLYGFVVKEDFVYTVCQSYDCYAFLAMA